jgi:hypothetical protein
MMKKLLIGLLAASLAVFTLFSAGCQADAEEQETVTENEAGERVFKSKDSLYSYTLNDNKEATITGYAGESASVIVNRIDGNYKVVAIGENAFANNKKIKTVELSDSVKVIGNGAFTSCTALEKIEFRSNKSSLQKIGNGAFAGCTALTSFKLPASLKTIGADAFLDCAKATVDFSEAIALESIGDYAFSFCGTKAAEHFTVVIPEKLTDIGHGAFYGCTKVNAFDVADANTVFSVKDGILYSKDGKTLVLYPPAANEGASFTIPSDVRVIEGSAFAGTGLKSVIVSEGVEEIGGSAFYFAYNLESISLPSTLKTLGSYAFLDCAALKEANIPENTEVGAFVFRNCTALTSVTLPSRMDAIPEGLFDSCSALTAITLPEGITEIGQFAFNYCLKLSALDIPETVRTIGAYAFRNCQLLKNIDISFVTDLGDFAFQNCKAMTDADISGLSEIPAFAFQGCTVLSDVKYSDRITAIGNYAFFACDLLESFDIPETVTAIGNYAFGKCNSLQEMTIPSSVTSLGMGVFYASGLRRAIIEAPITEIPVSFFDGCQKLSVLMLPETVEVISTGAFTECVQLKNIPLRKPVRHVATGAFTGCRNLETLVIGTEDTEIATGTFYGCENLKEIIIPEGIKTIGSSAFAECVSLTSVTFPSTLEWIDMAAFSGCNKLVRAELPASVTTIGDNAFSGCSKLVKIDIPKSVTYVGENAFYGTNWLKARSTEEFVVVGDGVLIQYNGNAKDIVIPDTVKRIPAYRFSLLKNEPTSFTIPSTVEFIAKDAFAAKILTENADGEETYAYRMRYVKIIGRKGTYAETFANHEYYTFEAID